MKKALSILLIAFAVILPSFAKEGDVHVTRTTTAVFNIDAGATVILPSDDSEKTFGVFGAVTFTPASFSKVNLGIKAELSLNGFAGEESKKLAASAFLLGRLYVRKSFEVYAGAGARYLVWDINSLNDFSHGWGVAAQAGARGRILNWAGVGIQASYLKGFGKVGNQLELQIYASLEF